MEGGKKGGKATAKKDVKPAPKAANGKGGKDGGKDPTKTPGGKASGGRTSRILCFGPNCCVLNITRHMAMCFTSHVWPRTEHCKGNFLLAAIHEVNEVNQVAWSMLVCPELSY